MNILIINGPNLNLIGQRETSIYGNVSFDEYITFLRNKYNDINIDYIQSNIEGEIINVIQQAKNNYFGIILNAGGYSYTSVAITDAIRAINIPVVEVHISNIYTREDYRKNSLTATACKGVIIGLGMDVYRLAVEHLIFLFQQ
ncbi:MAG TPA: type II 3-dehydroquinate dehydratase [Bacteroidales bacterium]|nr:type II 3-dehydroquinate dehydratase [Bacteroidales bacterium]